MMTATYAEIAAAIPRPKRGSRRGGHFKVRNSSPKSAAPKVAHWQSGRACRESMAHRVSRDDRVLMITPHSDRSLPTPPAAETSNRLPERESGLIYGSPAQRAAQRAAIRNGITLTAITHRVRES